MNNGTTYKLPANFVQIEDTTYIDVQAKDVIEAFEMTPEGKHTASELVRLEKEREIFSRRYDVVVPYSFALGFTVFIVAMLNIIWNNAISTAKAKYKKRKLLWRLIFFFLIIVVFFFVDYALVVISQERLKPILFLPYMGIIATSSITLIFKINRVLGNSDTNLEKLITNILNGKLIKLKEEAEFELTEEELYKKKEDEL